MWLLRVHWLLHPPLQLHFSCPKLHQVACALPPYSQFDANPSPNRVRRGEGHTLVCFNNYPNVSQNKTMQKISPFFFLPPPSHHVRSYMCSTTLTLCVCSHIPSITFTTANFPFVRLFPFLPCTSGPFICTRYQHTLQKMPIAAASTRSMML